MNMNVDAAQFDEPVGAGNDLHLVHATKNGDVGAFEQLVKRYDRKLLRIAQSVTRNKEDSQDVVQETFLKAFQKLAEFREDSKFSTWLIRITLNQSLMSLRKQRTKKEMSLDEEFQADEDALPLDVPDRGPNPEQLCWASEVRDIFLETLQELRPILADGLYIAGRRRSHHRSNRQSVECQSGSGEGTPMASSPGAPRTVEQTLERASRLYAKRGIAERAGNAQDAQPVCRVPAQLKISDTPDQIGTAARYCINARRC
jgi:RNA polymerase sigma factor (sigma-70 family)